MLPICECRTSTWDFGFAGCPRLFSDQMLFDFDLLASPYGEGLLMEILTERVHVVLHYPGSVHIVHQ